MSSPSARGLEYRPSGEHCHGLQADRLERDGHGRLDLAGRGKSPAQTLAMMTDGSGSVERGLPGQQAVESGPKAVHVARGAQLRRAGPLPVPGS